MSWTRRELFRSLFQPGALGKRLGGIGPAVRVHTRLPDDAEWKKLLDAGVSGHFSRGQEELLVRRFFRDRRDGVFVDAGCRQPEQQSGTCFLERYLGWSGVAIDRQDFSEPWRDLRPRSRFFQAELGEHEHNPGTTLDQVLEETGLESINFLSISVDLGDLAVLKGLDLRRYRPELIKIHCGPGQRVPTFEYLGTFG
ncbi:MAG: hypothetical protein AAGM22_31360, partial [Acidobacteriota bacterium]